MFSGSFALLSELKARLKITDTVDDAVLTEMLRGVSGAIESFVGRRLRRVHCVTETFSGGSDLIRVGVFPIARVHSIRESYTRSFSDADSGSYTELVENEDFVLEPGGGGRRPGESGWIRRIGGRWMGSPQNPNMIQVVYTGGLKTPDEVALENNTTTFDGTTNTSLMDVFTVANRYKTTVHEGYLAMYTDAETAKVGYEGGPAGFTVDRGVLVVRVGDVILPTWEIVEAVLKMTVGREDGSTDLAVDGYLFDYDPNNMLIDLPTLFDLIDDVEYQIFSSLAPTTYAQQTFTLHSLASGTIQSGTNMARLNRNLRRGFLAFAFKNQVEATSGAQLTMGIHTPRNSTPADRPSLELVHRSTIMDDQVVKYDLQHATMLQVAADWQYRRSPGVRAEVLRGTVVASGVSFTKNPAELLPEVKAVAENYVRVV